MPDSPSKPTINDLLSEYRYAVCQREICEGARRKLEADTLAAQARERKLREELEAELAPLVDEGKTVLSLGKAYTVTALGRLHELTLVYATDLPCAHWSGPRAEARAPAARTGRIDTPLDPELASWLESDGDLRHFERSMPPAVPAVIAAEAVTNTDGLLAGDVE